MRSYVYMYEFVCQKNHEVVGQAELYAKNMPPRREKVTWKKIIFFNKEQEKLLIHDYNLVYKCHSQRKTL